MRSVTIALNIELFHDLMTFSKTELAHAQSHQHMPIYAEQKKHDL